VGGGGDKLDLNELRNLTDGSVCASLNKKTAKIFTFTVYLPVSFLLPLFPSPFTFYVDIFCRKLKAQLLYEDVLIRYAEVLRTLVREIGGEYFP
jgi:hypothetical protein